MPLPLLGLLAGGVGRALLGGAARGGLSGRMMMRGAAGGGRGGIMQNLLAGGGESVEGMAATQALSSPAKRDFFELAKNITNKFEGSDKDRQDQRDAATKGPKPMMKILGQMAGKAKGMAGLNLSMAAFARSSTLSQGMLGAFNQVMSAYADMFLAPFAPYIFKFIGFLASGIDRFGKIWGWLMGGILTGAKRFLTVTMGSVGEMVGLVVKNWNTIWDFISNPFKAINWSDLWTGGGQSKWVLNITSLIENILSSLPSAKGIADKVGDIAESATSLRGPFVDYKAYSEAQSKLGAQEVMKVTNLAQIQAEFLTTPQGSKGGTGTAEMTSREENLYFGFSSSGMEAQHMAESNGLSFSFVVPKYTYVAEAATKDVGGGIFSKAFASAKEFLGGVIGESSFFGQ